MLLDLDVQPAVGQRLRGAGDAAVQALEHDGASRRRAGGRGRRPRRRCRRSRSPARAGHEQHALLVAGVDGQRERHAREDDDVVQRDKKKATHQVLHFR